MQLKFWFLIAPLGGLLPGGETSVDARPVPEEGNDRAGDVTVKVSSYHQQDRGGIEQVDETASVFEAVILANKPMTDTGTLNVRLLSDIVSAASIERAHNASFRAQQSGASGNYRVGGGAGWSERGNRLDWHAGFQLAAEYAYTSAGTAGGLTWNMPGRNTALSADVQVYHDTVKLIRYNGDNEGTDNRGTYTLDLGWHQIVTPIDVMQLSLSQTEQRGFLATSYNSVFTPSGEYSEELPDSRSRSSATLRWKHSFTNDSAGEIGGRYYTDDWKVSAVTLDFRFSSYFHNRHVLLEPTYRLYVQQASQYYQEFYQDPLPEYRTSDPDIGQFTGHMLGLKSGFLNYTLFHHPADWDVSFYTYNRNNGLRAFWIIVGHKLEF